MTFPTTTTLVVSPHLDDAVFSCGAWLAGHPGTAVVTVFAGAPADASRRTGWDADCGFSSAGEALVVRRQEDARALAAVGARACWLEFRDSQYEEPSAEEEIADALAALPAARAAGRWLLPMGLFHSDHALAHGAALRAAAARRPEILLYEDALYRAMPGLVQQRLAGLAAAGLEATPVLAPPPTGRDDEAKARAVAAYASQARAFGPTGLDDTRRPERYWRLRWPERTDAGPAPAPTPDHERTTGRWPTHAPPSSS